jgi:hypothetical protein
MVQISGAVVLVVATSTLIYVPFAMFRMRKRTKHTLDPIATDRMKHRQ